MSADVNTNDMNGTTAGGAGTGTTGTGTTMRSTIITASAGSGKTYTITKELARRIADGLAPSAFIATTFTNKAAAELSSRIRTRLMSEGLTEEAQALDSALVGTVNAVSAMLVRDFAIDAGLSPELETLTEDSAKRAFDLACDGIIADAESRHRGLIRRMGYDRPVDAADFDSRKSFAATVRDIAEAARQNLISPDALRASADESEQSLAGVLDELAETVDEDERPTWQRHALSAIDAAIECDAGTESKTGIARRKAYIAFRSHMESRMDDVTWNEWARLTDAKVPGGSPTKAISNAFLPYFEFDAHDIASNPAFRGDLAAMTRLVLDTAADCLITYDEYKKSLGLIDFTDQEVKALEVIRSSPAVRDAIAATYDVLVVDEFQDTNPIQLALFFELGKLAGEVIWVGDPKQSIYGFRGSDPSLMAAAIEALRENGEIRALDKSWRSHRQPLALTNELFSAVMPDDPNVRLGIDESIIFKRNDGDVRVWDIGKPGRGNTTWFASLASGMRDLLRETGLPGGRTAVLARTKSHVEAIVEALTAAGVPCTGEQADLRASREGQVIRAALGYLLDAADTRSLVELIVLLDDHAAHLTWFDDLAAVPDKAGRRELLREWGKDPSLRHLLELRAVAVNLTPVECVRQVIDAVDLRGRIARWSNPGHRMTSLDAFSGMASGYQDECRSNGVPVTLPGFLTWFDDAEPVDTASDDPDLVYVGTMHSSKGLEWDAVCVAVADAKDRFTPDGFWVASKRKPTMEDPLGGRHLKFWPAAVPDADLITEALGRHPEQATRFTASVEDSRRLSYVSLTRAAKHSILCPRTDFTGYDAIRETGVTLDWDDAGVTVTRADGTATTVPARVDQVRPLGDHDDVTPRPSVHPLGLDELRGDVPPRLHATVTGQGERPASADRVPHGDAAAGIPVPARITASGIRASVEERESASVTIRAELGAPLVSGGAEKWELVGEAVHDYLALDLDALTNAQRTAAAERLVAAWGVGNLVDADVLMESGRRWAAWLRAEFPGARVNSESPITWRNSSNQVAEGWIDQWLELGDGSVVLIDHKTYPGADPVEHVRKNYVGQLSGYADALDMAGRGRPKEILVHLPLKGLVVAIEP